MIQSARQKLLILTALLIAAVYIPIFILTKITPYFEKLFVATGQEIPLLTIFVIKMSHELSDHFLSVNLFAFIAIALLTWYFYNSLNKKTLKSPDLLQTWTFILSVFLFLITGLIILSHYLPVL